jgi:hypothetical protein
MSVPFIEDTVRNQIARKLSDAFFDYYGYLPAKSEVASWGNSLRAMAQIVQFAKLNDHGIVLEYELPSSSRRFDFMICGRNASHNDEAIIVELKQWSECEPAEAEGLVTTWVGGKHRELLHPSVQVGQYQQYLADTHSAFYEGDHPIRLGACSYLHNYQIQQNDVLLAAKFSATIANCPMFGSDGVDGLSDYLKSRLKAGDGGPVLARIEQSKYRPSRKLMDYVAETIGGRSPWILLDEQLVVYEKIRAVVADTSSSCAVARALVNLCSQLISSHAFSPTAERRITPLAPAPSPRRSGSWWEAGQNLSSSTSITTVQRCLAKSML